MKPFASGARPFQAAHASKTRGLTGDARELRGGQSAHLIDAEWDVPGAFLVTAISTNLGAPRWTLRTGLERALLVNNFTVQNDFFSQIVIARTISMHVNTDQATGPGTVQAVAVPISLDFSSIDLVNGQSAANGLGMVSPILASNVGLSGVPVSVASVELAPAGLKQVTVVNVSPAARTLYLRIGAAAAIAAGGYTIPIAPGGYYETPPNISPLPAVFGIWDGADAGGFANVTRAV